MAEPRWQHVLGQQSLDEVAVAAEVDLLDVRGAVGHAGARHQGVDRSAILVDRVVDGLLVSQVHMNGFDAGKRHLGEVHHHHLGTGVTRQLCRGRPHAGGSTDHQDLLAVVAECVEQ